MSVHPPISESAAASSAEPRRCPYCLEQIHPEAVRCRHCRSWLRGNPFQKEWFRSAQGIIAGVCQGLSEQFRFSVSYIRIFFVLATIFGAGLGLVLYAVLWLVMPGPQLPSKGLP